MCQIVVPEKSVGRDSQTISNLTRGLPVLDQISLVDNASRRSLTFFGGFRAEFENLPFMHDGVPSKTVQGQDSRGGNSKAISDTRYGVTGLDGVGGGKVGSRRPEDELSQR